MTDEIQAWTDADLSKRIVFLKTLSDLVTAEFKTAKKLAMHQIPKGASIPARSADDVKLGRINRTEPKPIPHVTDEAALDDYIRREHADKLVPAVELGDTAEILPILIDAGRTDLFTETTRIPGWLYQELEKRAATEPIPGITVSSSPGWITATAEPAAVEAVKELLAGAPVQLLALEEGK